MVESDALCALDALRFASRIVHLCLPAHILPGELLALRTDFKGTDDPDFPQVQTSLYEPFSPLLSNVGGASFAPFNWLRGFTS